MLISLEVIFLKEIFKISASIRLPFEVECPFASSSMPLSEITSNNVLVVQARKSPAEIKLTDKEEPAEVAFGRQSADDDFFRYFCQSGAVATVGVEQQSVEDDYF